jgi:hypothetical protein
MMFQRLDRDGDGKVKLDEIPAGAPDFVRNMLKRADKDGDGLVTRDEFQAAMPQMGPLPGGPPMGRGFGPPAGPRPEMTSPRHPQAGPPRDKHPQPAATARDPKIWFDRLDRDKDGQLSLDEFTAGMRMFHRAPGHSPRWSAMRPGGPRGRSPWGWMPQPPGPWSGSPWGRGPRMHGGPGFGPRPGMSPEQRAAFDKRVEQARVQAKAAWKKAMARRDQVRKEMAAKAEAPEKPKKEAEMKKPKADHKHAEAKKEAASRSEAAEKKPAEKKAPKKT